MEITVQITVKSWPSEPERIQEVARLERGSLWRPGQTGARGGAGQDLLPPPSPYSILRSRVDRRETRSLAEISGIGSAPGFSRSPQRSAFADLTCVDVSVPYLACHFPLTWHNQGHAGVRYPPVLTSCPFLGVV